METVFWTVLAGVITYVAGQLVMKLVIDPVHDLRRTIAAISHTLIERANIIANPGVAAGEVNNAASQELRKLSSQLHAHLFLVPYYNRTAWAFGLPPRDKLLDAATMLIGLSNSVYRDSPAMYDANAARVERICDTLGIYLPDHERLSKVESQGSLIP